MRLLVIVSSSFFASAVKLTSTEEEEVHAAVNHLWDIWSVPSSDSAFRATV